MNSIIKTLAWPLGIISLALLVIGLIAVTAPNMTIETLVLYFAVMLLIIGSVQLLIAIVLRNKMKLWLALASLSALFLVAGGYMIYNPEKSKVAFENAISIWAVSTGIIQLFLAFRNQSTRIFLLSGGILSIIIGLILYLNDNTQNMQFLFGFYTLLLSLFMLLVVFKIFRMKTEPIESRKV
jgi:uncharacterized membrane protein HdeD (DUF308 family)